MLPAFPYFDMQQLNLDWLLETIANMQTAFCPLVHIDTVSEDSDDGIINVLSNNTDNIPLGVSFIHSGKETDAVQFFVLFFRVNDENGFGYIMFHNSENISINQVYMEDGVWGY